jgi:hypothetical protein
MDDKVDLPDGKAGLAERGYDAEGLVLDRCGRLGDEGPAAGAAVYQDEIGECAADIDAGDGAARTFPIFRVHAEIRNVQPTDNTEFRMVLYARALTQYSFVH